MTEISDLVARYHQWLRDKTILKVVGAWTQVTTPYLDRHNDYIQIYVKKEGERFLVSDGSDTLDGLELDGCGISTPKRKALVELQLRGFGVRRVDDALQVEASEKDFPHKKHNLIQAILAINDMFYVSGPHVEGIFKEDVRKWLDRSDVRYAEDISVIGQSGFSRKFDFVIPRSKEAPERMLKVINNGSKAMADSLIVDWIDTRQIRPASSEMIAIFNDERARLKPNIVEALKTYDIFSIPWSGRDNSLDRLVA